jgi:hypothetical protein
MWSWLAPDKLPGKGTNLPPATTRRETPGRGRDPSRPIPRLVSSDALGGIPQTFGRWPDVMGHGENVQTTTRYLQYQSESHEKRGAWLAARNAGIEVAGSHRTPGEAAVDLIVRAADRAGLEP